MADKDYGSDGFKDDGNGVQANNPGDNAGSVSDYDSWDWKEIMAAINGTAASTDAENSYAATISNPQSLQDAANAFYQVQMTLQGVAQALSDQAKAIAGDDGPWKGDAADAFLDMMDTFSKQVKANADVLGGGSSGLHSVPQQLADNAVNLTNAINKINDIDVWYANQAQLMGVKPMSNGLIPIHEKPELVQMMTDDMRAVLKSLAGEYQVTIDSVKSPSGINGPGTNGPDTSGGPDDDTNIPDFDTDTGGGGAPPPDLSKLTSVPPPDTGTGGTGGLGDGGLDGLGTPDPFPGGTDTGGAGGGGPFNSLMATPSPFPGGDDLTDTGSDLDNALNPNGSPSPFDGGLDTDGLGDLGDTGDLGNTGLGGPLGISPTGFPGGTSTNGSNSPFKNLSVGDPSQFGTSDFSPEDFPGDLGTDGSTGDLSALGDGLGDDLGSPSAFPGGLGTESGLPSSLTDGLGSGLPNFATSSDGTGLPFEGGTGTGGQGTPYMPGMGGGMGAGGAGMPKGENERSDASGLLDPTAKPWAGDTGVGSDDVGSEFGASAGGEGLDGLPNAVDAEAFPGETGTGGEGTPYMPGMGGGMGGGAGGRQSGENERSDASGLLDPSTAPWTGDPEVGDEIEGGALRGGEGLDLPGDLSEEEAALPAGLAEEEAAAGEGMPYMPGMGGGTGAGTGGRQSGENERSDASGLLDPTAEPWAGDEDENEDEVGAEGGAAHGGAGLDLPVREAVAEFPAGTMVDSNGNPVPAEPVDAVPTAPGTNADARGGAAWAGERSDASGLLEPSDGAWVSRSDGTADDTVTAPVAPPVAPVAPPATSGAPAAAAQPAAAAPLTAAAEPAAAPPANAPAGSVAAPAGTEAGNWNTELAAGAALTGVAATVAATASASLPGAAPATGQASAPASASATAAGTPAHASDAQWDSELGDSGTGADGPADHGDGHRHESRPDGLILVGGLPVGRAGGRRDEQEERGGSGPEDGDAQDPAGPEGSTGPGGPRGPGGPDDPEPDGPDDEELLVEPDDRVAVAGAEEEELEDIAAWDAEGEEFAPMLWSPAAEDEQEVRPPGYSSEDEGTWGGTPAEPAPHSEGPQLTTWRPAQTAGPASTVTIAPMARSGAVLPDDYVPPQEDEPEEETEEEPKEEEESRGIADLLVQDENTWGALPAGSDEIG